MKKIYIAPSNQSANKYCLGDTNEAVVCQDIAARVEKLLAKYDCEVRVGKHSESLDTKCANAAAWGANIYVSMHSNAFNTKARGTCCFYCDTDSRAADSKRLATLINNEMAKIFPKNRGLYTSSSLIVCYNPKMPSCICEVAFHDNKEDATLILNNKDRIAQAYCNAIVNYLGLTEKQTLDNKPNEYAEQAIEWAVSKGILRGNDNGDYMLHSPVTRQDMLVFLYRAFH